MLIIHGKKDDTAVFHRHATVLYEQAKTPKQNIWLPEAGHSDIPETMGNQYAQCIKDFIRSYLP
ncbi:MAG: alpha/beta hydrolase [candidate division WOR-3 bacterium]|nr:alpha/beta hydrolase [candidate division WOR-3 bacterium]